MSQRSPDSLFGNLLAGGHSIRALAMLIAGGAFPHALNDTRVYGQSDSQQTEVVEPHLKKELKRFRFEAMDATGVEIQDVIQASSEEEATQQIREKGYYLTKIGPESSDEIGRHVSHLPVDDTIVKFTEQLMVLQDAGLPMLRSIRVIQSDTESPELRESLKVVAKAIETGAPLSDSLAQCPSVFDQRYVAMIKAGEAGNAMGTILEQLTGLLKTERDIQQKWDSALWNLIFTITITCLIFGSLVWALTWRMMKRKRRVTTVETRGNQQRILPALGCAALLWCSTYPICYYFLLRPLRQDAAIAMSLQNLGVNIASGIPILDSLRITEANCHDHRLQMTFAKIVDHIREGETIAQPLKQSGTVGDLVVNLVDVGEETGQLDTMLLKASTLYQNAINSRVERLTTGALRTVLVLLTGCLLFLLNQKKALESR